MQILSPVEVQKKSFDAELANKRTIADLATRIVEKTRELNALNDDIQRVTKSGIEAQIERNEKILVLNEEVAVLEHRKAEAMRPVTALRTELEGKLLEHAENVKELDKSREEVSRREEELMDRTEKAIDIEDNLNEREKVVSRRERGIQLEGEEVEKLSKQLQEKITKHTQEITAANAEYESKNGILTQKEHALEVREKAFSQAEAEWQDQRNRESRQLADQRGVLERALKRLET